MLKQVAQWAIIVHLRASMHRKTFFFDSLGQVAQKNICSRADNSKVNGQMWPEFKITWDFMTVLIAYKFDDDPIKNEVIILSATFSPL